MPDPIKVLPTTPDEVGLVHPIDGPLSADGSLWSYDAFTVQLLTAGTIRRFEAYADGAAKSGGKMAAVSAASSAAGAGPEAGTSGAPQPAAS